MASFSLSARSLQEFATVLRNLEDERIRMVSMAGLFLVSDSMYILREQGICCHKTQVQVHTLPPDFLSCEALTLQVLACHRIIVMQSWNSIINFLNVSLQARGPKFNPQYSIKGARIEKVERIHYSL